MSNPTDRLRMAAKIVDFEARRDSRGRIKVYNLPRGDGGGHYEVAGINDRYHPAEAAALRQLVESGRFDDAEDRARDHIASYTDSADRWTPHDSVEFYLRDCTFNRGAGGAAKIYQMALGVRVDGNIGPLTRDEGAHVDPVDFLPQIRAARERYEREIVRRDEQSPFWRGLVNRWDKALAFAAEFFELGEQSSGQLAPVTALSGNTEVAHNGRLGSPTIAEIAGAERLAEVALTGTAGETAFATAANEPGGVAVAALPATRTLNITELQRPLAHRSRTVRPTLVVLHATAGASAMSSINHLRGVGLSYHYIIARDGRDAPRTRDTDGSAPIIFHCVPDNGHAFHVGSTIPAPSGEGSFNKCSIGVSLANIQSGGEHYTSGQISALGELLAHLKATQPSLRYLTNHAWVQPWNRSDPLRIDARALAVAHGYEFFEPTPEQVREHRPRR